MRERHFLTVDAGCIFLRNNVPVRIDLGIAQNGRYPVFESLRNEMLQPLSFLVDFVPRVLKNIVQKQLEQPVMADQFPSPSLARGGQSNTVMLLVQNQRRPLQGEFLKHPRDGRSTHAQSLGECVGGDARILRSA